MKWLIIFGLIFFVWMFIAVRYRKQIQAAIYVWKMFRQMRQSAGTIEKSEKKQKAQLEVPLVKCAKCTTWVPQSNALNLRAQTFYCSTNCMESAVKIV